MAETDGNIPESEAGKMDEMIKIENTIEQAAGETVTEETIILEPVDERKSLEERVDELNEKGNK